jgi:hypothetical protein
MLRDPRVVRSTTPDGNGRISVTWLTGDLRRSAN